MQLTLPIFLDMCNPGCIKIEGILDAVEQRANVKSVLKRGSFPWGGPAMK
jgi:hypothetical protein